MSTESLLLGIIDELYDTLLALVGSIEEDQDKEYYVRSHTTGKKLTCGTMDLMVDAGDVNHAVDILHKYKHLRKPTGA